MRKSVLALVLMCGAVNVAAAADVDAGKQTFSARGCVGCHGPAGASTVPAYPVLKGKPAAFITEQLTAFRQGTRQNPIMNGMVASLSDADIANLAAYLSAQ